MVNGLGVVGWGVGGIEAEAAMLGQPVSMLIPQVLGVRLTGVLPQGATATDLVLTVTEILRKHGVVGKFVEFFGEGLRHLTIADRATLGNMCPEYGATVAIFPIDEMTLDYLRLTGRDESSIELVEKYARAQGLFRTDDSPEAVYSETLQIDLSTVEPSLAGPKRPQDRVALNKAKTAFQSALPSMQMPAKASTKPADAGGARQGVATSTGAVRSRALQCSIRAGGDRSWRGCNRGDYELHEHLQSQRDDRRWPCRQESRRARPHAKPWVKSSLAPGSKVVTEYLDAAACRRISISSDSTSLAMDAPPALATAVRCRMKLLPSSRKRTSSSAPC
jgi:aconitate hydratase